MCSIAGMINFQKNYLTYPAYNRLLVREMASSMRHRGPDASGEWVGEHAAFSHTRLAVIDPEGGAQPMKRCVDGYDFVITYNGELYNAEDLKQELSAFGYVFETSSDTEALLYCYIHYGEACAEKLNGIYAFCIWDSMRQRVFFCRDSFYGYQNSHINEKGFILAAKAAARNTYQILKEQKQPLLEEDIVRY